MHSKASKLSFEGQTKRKLSHSPHVAKKKMDALQKGVLGRLHKAVNDPTSPQMESMARRLLAKQFDSSNFLEQMELAHEWLDYEIKPKFLQLLEMKKDLHH